MARRTGRPPPVRQTCWSGLEVRSLRHPGPAPGVGHRRQRSRIWALAPPPPLARPGVRNPGGLPGPREITLPGSASPPGRRPPPTSPAQRGSSQDGWTRCPTKRTPRSGPQDREPSNCGMLAVRAMRGQLLPGSPDHRPTKGRKKVADSAPTCPAR